MAPIKLRFGSGRFESIGWEPVQDFLKGESTFWNSIYLKTHGKLPDQARQFSVFQQRIYNRLIDEVDVARSAINDSANPTPPDSRQDIAINFIQDKIDKLVGNKKLILPFSRERQLVASAKSQGDDLALTVALLLRNDPAVSFISRTSREGGNLVNKARGFLEVRGALSDQEDKKESVAGTEELPTSSNESAASENNDKLGSEFQEKIKLIEGDISRQGAELLAALDVAIKNEKKDLEEKLSNVITSATEVRDFIRSFQAQISVDKKTFDDLNQRLPDIDKKLSEMAERTQGEIEALRQTLIKDFELHEAAKYWEKTEKDAFSKTLASLFGLLLTLFFTGCLVILAKEWIWKLLTTNVSSTVAVTALIILFSIIVLIPSRIFYSLFTQNYTIHNDAAARVTMIRTFISLVSEKVKTQIGDGDRAIILGAIFRPSPGQKDDGLPTTLVEMLGKLLERKTN